MQDALPIVIVAVVAVAAVIAVLTLARGKGVYDDIRAGDISPAPRGTDDLRAEVRAHVVARNRRLEARGEVPLDVESEVERRLAELDG
jgi:hypothetical protein